MQRDNEYSPKTKRPFWHFLRMLCMALIFFRLWMCIKTWLKYSFAIGHTSIKNSASNFIDIWILMKKITQHTQTNRRENQLQIFVFKYTNTLNANGPCERNQIFNDRISTGHACRYERLSVVRLHDSLSPSLAVCVCICVCLFAYNYEWICIAAVAAAAVATQVVCYKSFLLNPNVWTFQQATYNNSIQNWRGFLSFSVNYIFTKS